MRKLSPFKAIAHALKSVWSYRGVAFRIGLVWAPVLLAALLIEVYAGPPDPAAAEPGPQALIQLLSGIVSIIAVCAMAVSWHRFILRDEVGRGLKLDGHVLRYAGNTVLIMLAMIVPALVLLVGLATGAQPFIAAGLPLAILFGGLVTRLSIKLPAVALGNAGFRFRDAWAASADNFWPCVGVFLINAVILIGVFLVLALLTSILAQISAPLAMAFQVAAAIPVQIFYSIFNASIFTSLYGFFVERRDF